MIGPTVPTPAIFDLLIVNSDPVKKVAKATPTKKVPNTPFINKNVL
jgi:hypothetical protein